VLFRSYSDPTGIDLTVELAKSDYTLTVNVTYRHKTYSVETSLFGLYNLENIKAAIATGLFLGIEIDDIVDAMKGYQPGNNRSQLIKTKNNTLICDAYNANPDSMSVAIDSFAQINADKKMCILGDMLELGEKSSDEHTKILKALRKNKLENVLLTGAEFSKVAGRSGFKTFPDVSKLREFLKSEKIKDHSILVKGSRAMAMEKIYDVL